MIACYEYVGVIKEGSRVIFMMKNEVAFIGMWLLYGFSPGGHYYSLLCENDLRSVTHKSTPGLQLHTQ